MADWSKVRIILLWWRRGESNPCPKTRQRELLRVQSVIEIPLRSANGQALRSVASSLHGSTQSFAPRTFTAKGYAGRPYAVLRPTDGSGLCRYS